MNRKVYCGCDSDFTSHYRDQAGKGYSDIPIYRGQPYQRGYGLGSFFKRIGIPILKFLGKHLLQTGVNIGQDILDKKDFKDSLKKRGKEGARATARETLNKLNTILDQSGSGIRKRGKRKKVTKKKKINKPKKKIKRLKKDIFE